MAGHLYLAVDGGVLGAALFPTGLIAVILTSAELFTGDALVFVASVLGGKVSFGKLLRNWTVSWIMNFAGCLFWAAVLAYASDSLEDLGRSELAVKVALKKAMQPWWHIFLKAIGANFMVCVGVWQATCAEEVAGKILAIWFPISAFVLMGFDHVIANQFFIPVGMLYGADISISHLLFQALLPATLGNIVGGGIMVGAVYWYVYDSMTSSKRFVSRIREGWASARRHSTTRHDTSISIPKDD
jgi:formate/nitrite transporter